MLDAERDYYLAHNAAAHRGAHLLGEEATDAYEGARERVAAFIGADPGEIIFTRNATEAANLIAYSFSNAATAGRRGRASALGPGDEVADHRARAPRQPGALAAAVPAHRRDAAVVPGDRRWPGRPVRHRHADQRAHEGRRDHAPVQRDRGDPTGRADRRRGARGRRDRRRRRGPVGAAPPGAASRDRRGFVYFSGHKMLAPTGIGVLWGRRQQLEAMPPFITGGSMIEVVRMEGSTFPPPPQRFEAGMPPSPRPSALAGLRLPGRGGMENVAAHEHMLTARALDAGGDPRSTDSRPADHRGPRRRRLLHRRRSPPA